MGLVSSLTSPGIYWFVEDKTNLDGIIHVCETNFKKKDKIEQERKRWTLH